MRYEVHFQNPGSLKQETDDLNEALATARAMGNWNHPCDVIDTETGETVYTGQAYNPEMVGKF